MTLLQTHYDLLTSELECASKLGMFSEVIYTCQQRIEFPAYGVGDLKDGVMLFLSCRFELYN